MDVDSFQSALLAAISVQTTGLDQRQSHLLSVRAESSRALPTCQSSLKPGQRAQASRAMSFCTSRLT